MTKDLLISAIETKSVVNLAYHGYHRTVEPHRLFEDEKRVLKLFCWQMAGGSESGDQHGWKILKVDEIWSATKTGIHFSSTRSGYKPVEPSSGRIYAQL